MKTLKGVEPLKQTGLTYEELKKCKGFENITQAEAEKELEVINRIAKMMYYMYMSNQQQKD